MKKMSEIQMKIYMYIVFYVKENLYPPTVREIGKAVGLRSTSSVFSHLQTLDKMGLIKVRASEPRAIKILGYQIVSKRVLKKLYEDYTERGGE